MNKRTKTFSMTRAAVMIFLALLTTVTAWAQNDPFQHPDAEGNVTITAAGTYNASGNFNNIIIIIIADGVGAQGAVTLNVGNLTISGNIQNENSPIIWNVSEGSSLTFTGNEPIHVDEFNMSGGELHINNMEIMAECTISGGSFNTTTFAVAHATISGATINTGTFQVIDVVTINAANPSLSITAQNFYFYTGSITITNGGLTDGTNEYSGTITVISTSGVTTLTPINKVTVTLDAQGGSGGTTSVEATPNIAMPSITPPSWTGHIFGGYFTETNGGGTQYYYADGTSAKNCDFTQATTLYAKWTDASITLPTPTKTGFAFDGWYSDAECNTLVGDAGSSYTPGSDVTLYARWKKLLSNSDLSLPRVRCMPEKSHQPLPSTAAP